MPLYTPFGDTEGTITEGNDPRIPTQSEKDALVGSSGTPSAINPYVTGVGLASLTIDDLANVNISVPTVNQVLQFNGMNWVNGISTNTSVGSGVVLYFKDIAQFGTLELLSSTPSGAENTDTAIVVNTDSPQPIDQYVTSDLHRTQLDAGIWEFDLYRYISSGGIDGITTITTKVGQNFLGAGTISISAGPGTSRTATVTGGTPFLLADADAGQLAAGEISTPLGTFPIIAFISSSVVTVQTPAGYVGESGVVYYVARFLFNATTIPIVDVVVTLESVITVQPVYTGFDPLDELFIKLYASTTSAISKTVDFVHQGNAHFSNVRTPLITRHNDLSGLQGGIPGGGVGEEYHLTLAAFTIATQAATTSVSGYLSSTDWNTFNSKLTSTLASADIFVGNGSNVATAVAMSNDATLANTGALTLATVNSNVGSFTNANITVNAKGLITAASSGSGSGVTSITGTANEVLANGTTGSAQTGAVTLTTPQAIGTASTPTFASETLSATTNQLILGSTNTLTITNTQVSSHILTIPAIATSDTLVTTGLAQSITGVKTMTNMTTDAGTLTVPSMTITNGTLLTTATANTIENNGVAFFNTVDTTNGRRYSDAFNIFRLTANGSAISTIADFFGTNDGIPLVVGGIYAIEWHCYLTKATAGVGTWTIVNTQAPVNMTVNYISPPVGGMDSVGNAQTAGAVGITAASQALPVTGSLQNTQNYYYIIRAIIEANASLSSNVRLQLSTNTGTITPLRDSYFIVRRLPTGNTGTFVA